MILKLQPRKTAINDHDKNTYKTPDKNTSVKKSTI